jgi:hypothetical protein
MRAVKGAYSLSLYQFNSDTFVAIADDDANNINEQQFTE